MIRCAANENVNPPQLREPMVARIRPEVKIPPGVIVLWSLARCTVGSYLNVEFPHLPILFRDADRGF